MTYRESDLRLGELILHVCKLSDTDENFGAVKLNKILFYSDFLSYANRARTITGADYWNLHEGPAPRRLVQVRNELVRNQALKIEPRTLFGLTQHRPVSLRDADLGLFRKEDLRQVEETIKENWELTATQISEKSHLEWGWKLTKERQLIDLKTIFLAPYSEPSEDELRKISAMLGEVAA